MKICIQAGHEGRTTGSTGAPSEQSFNIDISNQVADELRKRGFEVKRVNADPLPEEIGGDWDFFLAIHYDADLYGSGGFFTDYPEPSTDGVTDKSQKAAYLLRQEYGGTTGIVYHPERSNVNTRYYYMWKKLSWNTPCVLIECGVGMHVPDYHSILHFNRPLVVEGIVKGLCLYFNVPFSLPEPPSTPETPSVPSLPPEPPPSLPSEPTVPSVNLFEIKLNLVKDIIWGKGWPWSKIKKLKELLPL